MNERSNVKVKLLRRRRENDRKKFRGKKEEKRIGSTNQRIFSTITDKDVSWYRSFEYSLKRESHVSITNEVWASSATYRDAIVRATMTTLP